MAKVLILGAGPAGVSASLYTARAGVDTTVLTRGSGALEKAEKIQNWIDSNFVEGSVTWEMDGASAIKVTDRTGDSMVIQLAEID